MQLGFIGLGKMGSNMVMKLLGEGHEVVVWNRSPDKIENLRDSISSLRETSSLIASLANDIKGHLETAENVEDLVNQLESPRIIWSMLPAGEATEEILGEVEKYVDAGDIVIDGGNSYFEDTQKRFGHFSQKGILFLGVGVSGGIIAAKSGYPLMVGGDRQAYDYVKPVLDSLAKPTHSTSSGQSGGHEYFGDGGAGHFVKMVHNGIEYGYMQAIGEGFGVLDKAPYDLDLKKVAKLYTKGTLLSGFMMDRTVEVLEKDPKLGSIEGYIEASGEGEWTVNQAKKENVPVENIEQALKFREKSREDKSIAATFAARMVAALRKAFGGHEVKKKQ